MTVSKTYVNVGNFLLFDYIDCHFLTRSIKIYVNRLVGDVGETMILKKISNGTMELYSFS